MHDNASCADHWVDDRVFPDRIVICRGIIIDCEDADSGRTGRSYNCITFDANSKTKVNLDSEVLD